MCSLVCKIKKLKKNSPEREKNWGKKKKDVSQIMPLTDENKEKNAENLKKARKNDEKTEPWWIKIHFIYKRDIYDHRTTINSFDSWSMYQ